MTRAIKRTIVYLAGAALLVVVIDLSGIFRHPFEKDYFSKFSYPLDLPNFASVVKRYGNNEPTAYDPINYRYANLTYLKTANTDCNEEYRLIILVKSAPNNFRKRQAIRSTWGYRKRFSDVPIKTVFMLGLIDEKENAVTPDYKSKIKDPITLNEAINEESAKYGDLIQADFIDSYYNNTYKTLMGMRWLVETCKLYRYAFFADDDMYVSVKNLLKFFRHPTSYPEYWENQKKIDKFIAEQHYGDVAKKYKQNRNLRHAMKLPISSKNGKHIKSLQHDNVALDEKSGKVKVWKNSPVDFDIDLDDDVTLYGGYVYFLPPYRHKLGSKWYLSLDEYPYSYLPPFVPAGAIALSRSTVFDLYYASLFTKHLRFDDVFIAICAKKMGIEPYHSEYFRLKPSYPVMDRDDIKLEYLITWHGFDDPDTLVRFWSAQKSLGNA
ncbi:Beta-1,3-galactosyltransferase brn [Orchesella cincta]|uniref:Hexosyltransferase n=1 Tax=Orchesella cincta TaxID=48709 RepID=A0A1D2MUV2_ORCCI|nr:Beta-1,3-galactosyltransferase brn [Orchesella cincta]